MCRTDKGSLNLDCALGHAKGLFEGVENCGNMVNIHMLVNGTHTLTNLQTWGGKKPHGMSKHLDILYIYLGYFCFRSCNLAKRPEYLMMNSSQLRTTHTHQFIFVTRHNGGNSTPSDTTVYNFNRIFAGRDKSLSRTGWSSLSLSLSLFEVALERGTEGWELVRDI